MKLIHLSEDTLAQGSHVGWAAFLVVLQAYWTIPAWIACLDTLAFFALKEAVWDPLLEDAATEGSGTRDMIYIAIGVGIGLIAIIIKHI